MYLLLFCRQTVTILLLAISLNMSAQINTALKPYHDRFIKEAKSRGITLTGTLLKLDYFNIEDKDYHGITIYPDKAVYVNQSYWDTVDETRREILMFHELAHFYLYAGHIAHRYDIMNDSPSDKQLAEYRTNRKTFIDKLFELCVEL